MTYLKVKLKRICVKRKALLQHSKDAVFLLAQNIKLERKRRKMSETDLADRAGIARSTLQRIEKGDPSVEIGTVFNVAHIAGVQLFGTESEFTSLLSRTEDKLALLPKRIRNDQTDKDVYDDF